MVRCPLILSQPFHFEFSAGLDNYFRLAKYFLSVNTDVIAVRQLSVVVIRPTSTDCGVSRPVVSPLLSVFLGLHGHLSLSEGGGQYACPGSVMSAGRLDGTPLPSSLISLTANRPVDICCLQVLT